MNNNDALIRMRYAFNLSDKEVRKIFALGGLNYTNEEVRKILIKSKEDSYFHKDMSMEEIDALEDNKPCTNPMLERFLNGLIIQKRGPQELKPGQTPPPEITIQTDKSVNNVILKKLKIALALTVEDIIEILQAEGVTIGKSELGALLRKEGHKHYRYCGDNYTRKFLRGLGKKYRPKK